MNSSESVGVDAINLVRVSFTSNVDNSDTLIRSLWSYLIIATSSSIKYTTANGDRPLSAFTKAAIFPVSDDVQSLFTNCIYHDWL